METLSCQNTGLEIFGDKNWSYDKVMYWPIFCINGEQKENEVIIHFTLMIAVKIMDKTATFNTDSPRPICEYVVNGKCAYKSTPTDKQLLDYLQIMKSTLENDLIKENTDNETHVAKRSKDYKFNIPQLIDTTNHLVEKGILIRKIKVEDHH